MLSNFSVANDEGKDIIFNGDEVYQGLEVNTYDDNGDVVPLTDGTYVINGIEVIVANGVVTELVTKEEPIEASIEPELEPIEEEVEVPTEEVKQDENEAYMNEIAELKESILALQSENDELKAELENLKKPADKPIKGSTLMNSNVKNDIPKEIKGSKFERAYNVFNN